MKIRQLTILIALTSLLSACVDYYGGQEPAPVMGGNPNDIYSNDPYLGKPVYPDEAPQAPPPVTKTKPLEGSHQTPKMVEIQPDLPPSNPPPQTPDPGAELTDPFATEETQMPESDLPADNPVPAEGTRKEQTAEPETPKEPEKLTPLESFAPQSPAVDSLLLAANADSDGGNVDSAVSSIERAIRIEPRNATLYYKLAVLRLKQSKPRLAEDLARKAALLAVNDNPLKKHSWLLIANARTLQSNVAGANKAKAEAAKY